MTSIAQRMYKLYPQFSFPNLPWALTDDGSGPIFSRWDVEVLGPPKTIAEIEAADLPVERRKIDKDIVEARMAADGTLNAAMKILQSDADMWRRWYARGFPWVYTDDADTIKIIELVGSDPSKILA